MSTWLDAHLDLAYLAVGGRDLERPCVDGGCVSLPALRAARVDVALATIFTEPGADQADEPHGYRSRDDVDGAAAAGREQLAVYETLERRGAASIVRRRADLGSDGPRPRLVILMEGADPIRDPDDVTAWHDAGLRVVGLTWAAGTRYAGGNASGGPLTPDGIALVAALDAAGIVHDASHLSDAALDGLLAHATGPVVATHSNCRALVKPDERHLRDEHIAEIGRRDGVVGLNLYTAFLATGRRATVADCVAHVERVADVMGHRRAVGLGSDMDGGFGPDRLPADLDHPARLEHLADALRDAGWSDDEVEGFTHRNWLRFLEGALPA
ncbi:MAG: dipeptidase [Planctomycetota bacterium]|jgi:membrane dipeptidase